MSGPDINQIKHILSKKYGNTVIAIQKIIGDVLIFD